ncbi:MAG TPA: hypothetical protein VJN18_03725 [Polyangiaceae bacterium]|nr:hypothetical protein [Polyangiaceae bacterium]
MQPLHLPAVLSCRLERQIRASEAQSGIPPRERLESRSGVEPDSVVS